MACFGSLWSWFRGRFEVRYSSDQLFVNKFPPPSLRRNKQSRAVETWANFTPAQIGRNNGWTCGHKFAEFFGQGKHCLWEQEMFAQKCCVHLTVSCEVSVHQQHQRGSAGPLLASRWKDLRRFIWTVSQRPRNFLGIHCQGEAGMDQTFRSSDGLWSLQRENQLVSWRAT